MHEAIKNTITYGMQEGTPLPTDTQPAYHAVVHLVVPDVGSEAAAADYISETLRDLFLDWQYVMSPEPDAMGSLQTPIQITVSKPYLEGSFLNDVES
jgi:hypothetical protein